MYHYRVINCDNKMSSTCHGNWKVNAKWGCRARKASHLHMV